MSDLLIMTMNAFTARQMRAMETKVLQVLEFDVNCTPSQTFSENYSRAAGVSRPSVLIYTSFLLDLSLIKSEFLTFKTSQVTCCALAIALRRDQSFREDHSDEELDYLKEIMHQEQFSSNIFNQCKTIFEHLT